MASPSTVRAEDSPLAVGVTAVVSTAVRGPTLRMMLGVGGGLVGYAVALAVLGYTSAQGAATEVIRPWLVTTSIAAGVLYFGGLGLARRRSAAGGNHPLLWIIAAGLLMRGIILAAPPFLEDDYFRYLWDGAVTAHGINPYAHAPDQVAQWLPPDDGAAHRLTRIAEEGRTTLTQINHSELRTIYGPTAQIAFAVAYWIGPWSPFVWRGLLLIFDLATLALVLHALRAVRAPLWWSAWYWWNPILLREITSSGHMDMLLFPFVLAALLFAARRRYVLSASLLAVAVGVKIWPVVLLPLVLRPALSRGKRLAIALLVFSVISAGLWWPVSLAPWDPSSGFRTYAQSWQNNDAIFSTVVWASRQALVWLGNETWHAQAWARRVVVGLALLWMLRVTWPRPTSVQHFLRSALFITAGVFLLSPAQFPWYFLWMLPLLAVMPRVSLLFYTALLPLYYLNQAYPWVVWVEHLPICVLLICETLLRHRHTSRNLIREGAMYAA